MTIGWLFIVLVSVMDGNSKAWAATQRRFNKDFTMGLSSLILSLMGPRALGLLVKADPNIDPNQQLHDGSGNVLDRRFLPYFIKEVRLHRGSPSKRGLLEAARGFCP